MNDLQQDVARTLKCTHEFAMPFVLPLGVRPYSSQHPADTWVTHARGWACPNCEWLIEWERKP